MTDAQEKVSQSEGLSKRHLKYNEDGHHLTDDSKLSEKILKLSMDEIIIPYAEKKIKELFDGKIKLVSTISLYELQVIFNKIGGPEPNIENKKVYMKPDGGILIAIINDKEYPILISEDKVQGSNDIRKQKGLEKQATGNAIERGGKNIRGAEMLFSSMDIFPYALFTSGCDFHSSETIAKRIEMMNYGYPNHKIELSSTHEIDIIEEIRENILPKIIIKKRCGRDIVSVFVKSHKFDDMEHNSSKWKKEEIGLICCDIIDKVCIELYKNI